MTKALLILFFPIFVYLYFSYKRLCIAYLKFSLNERQWYRQWRGGVWRLWLRRKKLNEKVPTSAFIEWSEWVHYDDDGFYVRPINSAGIPLETEDWTKKS